MTLDEMILEVFDGLGRPTDISPLDELDDNSTINPDLPGYKQLQRWVNQGYKAITTWRTSNGRFYRMRDLITRLHCQHGPYLVDYSFTAWNPAENPELHTLNFPTDDHYVGYMPPGMVLITLTNLGDDLSYLETAEEPIPNPTYLGSLGIAQVEGEFQNVYQTTDADWCSLGYFIDEHTVYCLNQIPWIIPDTEMRVYEKGINLKRFDADIELYAIRKVRIVGYDTTVIATDVVVGHTDNYSASCESDSSDMELAPRTENFTGNLADINRPTAYYREQDYIYFDWHVDREYTYQLEFDRVATDLAEGTDVPVIQRRFHVPIVYWAIYRGLLRFGENTDAWSISKFLDTEMRSIIKEQDLDIERLEGGFTA